MDYKDTGAIFDLHYVTILVTNNVFIYAQLVETYIFEKAGLSDEYISPV